MNGSNIRLKRPSKSTRIASHVVIDQYFDLSGRLIKNRSIKPSALIVHRAHNQDSKTLLMIK